MTIAAAIIQARMGSSRLPGKVLRPLVGKPVLWHVIHRLRKCRSLDVIAVATSTSPTDDPLAAFCEAEGIPLVRGDENNVLKRYVKAAEHLNADYILRVTGDSPLIDPETVDSLIHALPAADADVSYLAGPKLTIHEGFTAISRRTLNAQATYGKDDPAVCEHVTVKMDIYVPDLKVVYVPPTPAHCFEGARISIDTPADLTFVEKLYERLGATPGEIDISSVVRLLQAEPALLSINQHVRQKSADQASYRALIRCDADSRIGMGHMMRSLSLATHLRDSFSIGVAFAVSPPAPGSSVSAQSLAEQYDFPVHVRPENGDEAAWIDALLQKQAYDALIFDIRTDLSADAIASWRDQGYHTACIDEPSPRRLSAHQVFYPPVPQVPEMDWRDAVSNVHHGWDWVLMGPSFAKPPSPPLLGDDRLRILVSMGGADPANLTSLAIDALSALKQDVAVDIVVGHGFPNRTEIKRSIAHAKNRFRLLHDVEDMATVMAQADLAVASFGVTAYELAASGVPSVLLGLTDDHVRAAGSFVDAGISRLLGLGRDVSPSHLTHHVDELIGNEELRHEMRDRARDLALHNGPANVAKAVHDALESAPRRLAAGT